MTGLTHVLQNIVILIALYLITSWEGQHWNGWAWLTVCVFMMLFGILCNYRGWVQGLSRGMDAVLQAMPKAALDLMPKCTNPECKAHHVESK